MTANRYGNFLTIILVVLVILVLGGLGFMAYNIIKSHSDDGPKTEAIAEFDKSLEELEQQQQEEDVDEEEQPVEEDTTEPVEDQNSTAKVRKKTYYKGFVMLGYITIPKTKVKEPILDTVTPASLDTAVATLYPSNPQLNQPGNVVIIGHNYRNGKFFSNNKKLSTGDKIKVKDSTNTELTYTIYEIFETTEQDTSFYDRDTNGAIEITLSTCTDDAKARTIILARAE